MDFAAVEINKVLLIQELRATAAALKPLSEGKLVVSTTDCSATPTKHWRDPDPYALAWWSTLVTIAGMIEAQDSPLNTRQVMLIKSALFGSMGSVGDLRFDPTTLGEDAVTVKQRLHDRLAALRNILMPLSNPQ
jgi:hypothetical protein